MEVLLYLAELHSGRNPMVPAVIIGRALSLDVCPAPEVLLVARRSDVVTPWKNDLDLRLPSIGFPAR